MLLGKLDEDVIHLYLPVGVDEGVMLGLGQLRARSLHVLIVLLKILQVLYIYST